MFAADFLLYIVALSFVAYCPVLSWLDWKYGDIRTHYIWLPLIAVNMPILCVLYYFGIYPPILFPISLIEVAAWFILWLIKIRGERILPGGDVIFLSLISMFLLVNPKDGISFFQYFGLYLLIFTAAGFWYIFLDNLIRKHKISIRIEGGIPYLVLISAALITALVMG